MQCKDIHYRKRHILETEVLSASGGNTLWTTDQHADAHSNSRALSVVMLPNITF